MFAVSYDEVVNMLNKRSVNFDTLKYANRLKAVGVPDIQAETQAELQAELQAETIIQQTDTIYDFSNSIIKNLATKQNVDELRLATKQDIDELKQDIVEIKQDIVEIKQDIVNIKQDIVNIKQDIVEIKQDIVEIKQDINKLSNGLMLLEERTDKNIAQMGYKIMITLVGALASMTAVLGYLIKTS